MKIADARNVLTEMLTSESVDLRNPDALHVWSVFKRFAEMPVDAAGDALLYSFGMVRYRGRFLLNLLLCRQFTINDDRGEYDHMEQLQCQFWYEPSPKFAKRKKITTIWCLTGSSKQRFFEDVERREDLRAVASLPLVVFECEQAPV